MTSRTLATCQEMKTVNRRARNVQSEQASCEQAARTGGVRGGRGGRGGVRCSGRRRRGETEEERGDTQHVKEDSESQAPPSVRKEAAFMTCLEG